MSENASDKLSAEATRVFEYGEFAVYLAPTDESIQCLVQGEQSVAFALSEVEALRDNLEAQRDRRREKHRSSDEGAQSLIDALVILERAVKYTQSSERSDRGRHYRRVSALHNHPALVIRNIENVIEEVGQNRATTFTSRLGDKAGQWLQRFSEDHENGGKVP